MMNEVDEVTNRNIQVYSTLKQQYYYHHNIIDIVKPEQN